MKHILIIAALLFTPIVNAGQWGLTLGSFHLTDNAGKGGIRHNKKKKGPYNEINPGITYTTDSNIMMGTFVNSYSGVTVFAGKRFLLPSNKKIGLDLGLSVYGNYKWKDDNQLSPIVQATYDINNWRIGFSPMFSEHSYGVFTLQYMIPTN